jgi:hypothetical protein
MSSGDATFSPASGLAPIRHCPRCDYDVRTQIEVLKGAGEKKARGETALVHCPECGLAFDEDSYALGARPEFGCFAMMAIMYVSVALVEVASGWFAERLVDWSEVIKLLIWGAVFVFGVVPLFIRIYRARTRPDSLITADGLWIGGRGGQLVPWSEVIETPPARGGDGAPWSAPKSGEMLRLTTRPKKENKKDAREILVLHVSNAAGAMRLIRARIGSCTAAMARVAEERPHARNGDHS